MEGLAGYPSILSSQSRKDPENPDVNDDIIDYHSQLWSKNPDEIRYIDKLAFSAAGIITGLTVDAIMQVLNKTHIKNHENFLNHYEKKDRQEVYQKNHQDITGSDTGVGLLTFGNHDTYLDDPLTIAPMLRLKYLNSLRMILGDDREFQNFHWMPAAKENFFDHRDPLVRAFYQRFFGYTKTVPLARKVNDGRAIDQRAFNQLINWLNHGDWVNYYPEGGRSKEQRTDEGNLCRFQKGIGKLILNSPNTILLPYGHSGMDQVTPYGCPKELEVNDHRTNEILRNYRIVRGEIKEALSGKLSLPKILKAASRFKELAQNFVRTRQHVQIVFGEPIPVYEITKNVPNNDDGYIHVAATVQELVQECLKESISINKENYRA